MTVVLLFIAFGVAYINPENWDPFIRPPRARASTAGAASSAGPAVIFFAYIGFDAVSTAAQETQNPQSDMPIGILGSLAICTVLYIVVALVLTGIVQVHRSSTCPIRSRSASTPRVRLWPGSGRS